MIYTHSLGRAARYYPERAALDLSATRLTFLELRRGTNPVSRTFQTTGQCAKVQPEGYALSFGAAGFVLTVPGTTICVMWPYTKVLHANIMMGEPALATSRH